ncbi:MAG: hypothetical protein GY742_15805 [Hyphomicrobiales bacterium]|nr:hypothetical protein [Hyphomicrobiales bacterium]
MIITDSAVFLQLPKCASTSLQRALKQHFNGRQFGKHARIENAPKDEMAGKPIVGGIRDPHSWYLSLWQYGCSQRGINWMSSTSPVVHGQLPQSADARLRSAEVIQTKEGRARHIECETKRDPSLWQQIYSDANDALAFRYWLSLIHEPSHQFVCFPEYGHAFYSDEAGLFTHVFLQLYAKSNETIYIRDGSSLSDCLMCDALLPDRLIRQSSFADDFVRVLRETDHDVTTDTEANICQAQRVNVSGGESRLSSFYDRKSWETVMQRDRLLINALSGEYGTLLFGELQIAAMP